MKKIFMTGSTSYVGTKFIELYGKRFDILGVARTDLKHPVDLLDFEAVGKLFEDFKPDFVLHIAADLGRDTTTSDQIIKTNPAITKNLVDLAQINKTSFLFTSTESVYGGRENGGYIETDPYKPRNPYGASKVESEKIVMASGLPYLITRGYRHVGISKNFDRPKQFPDALNELTRGREIHLDSRKLFTPVLINNVCDIFVYYMEHDADKQVLINMGVDKPVTFYQFVVDVAHALGLDANLIKPDGEEAGWPMNNTLSFAKLHELGYPNVTYEQLLDTIKSDFSALPDSR
ncbi:MAG TPA: NAD(P)-dependent oxidoreductase [Candidatus Saccharimonadia bacterium]|nr:NAD(P)-dependent oxidoreductase [Candidatus Saccharimonadia bacterium]